MDPSQEENQNPVESSTVDAVNPESMECNETANESVDESEICSTLTLNDVLQIQDELIEDTAAVLGAANDKNCSYNEGYLKRQALYSCLTCIPEAKTDPERRAGVCLACSYHCHDGHELIELYTKRNFRCDCGNNKFSNFQCNLTPVKNELNEKNSYNQNFSGVYCVCHRPYPDMEDPLPDEMIQCIICEDWYHSRHLGIPVPSESFAEMICASCVKQHEFLMHYDEGKKDSSDLDTSVDVMNVSSTTEGDVPAEASNAGSEEPKTCSKPKTKAENATAKFLQHLSWRKQLCTCADCLEVYKTENVLFLIDPEDPVHLYEELGKAKAQQAVEDHDRKVMNSVPRVQLIEVLHGYNDLKENLANYLKKFAENKKVVKEEDIKEFFEGMKARKKQKCVIPNLCR